MIENMKSVLNPDFLKILREYNLPPDRNYTNRQENIGLFIQSAQEDKVKGDEALQKTILRYQDKIRMVVEESQEPENDNNYDQAEFKRAIDKFQDKIDIYQYFLNHK